MSEIRVANRYAKALIGLAEEKGFLEEVYQDAQQFLDVCKENRDFEVILSNPIIPQEKKVSIATRLFSDNLSEQTLNFILLIVRKGRGSLLVPTFEQLKKSYKRIKGIASAKVYSPIKLSDEVLDRLKQTVEHGIEWDVNQVELDNQIDDTLLGGFFLQFEDKLLDKSVNTQLKELRRAFKN